MKKYTLSQFQKDYPNDDACLDKIFKMRFAGLVCPTCNDEKKFSRVSGRRSYQCTCCGFQVYPTKGTVLEKTTTPLKTWFQAMFMHTTTRNGVAAKELERTFGVCYKTALRMSHQIKIMLSDKNTNFLNGTVELDECFIGGQNKNRHASKRKELGGRGATGKQAVFGIVVRRDGIVRATVINDVSANTLRTIISNNVNKDATIMTDSATAYTGLNKEFKKHGVINHNKGEYVRGNIHTNTIEGFWSQLKRTISGTHIQVNMFTLMMNRLAF